MLAWQSRLASMMRGSGGGWTPPTRLAAWWYGGSLTEGAWTDRSGNGKHATLAGAASVSDDNGISVASGSYAYIAESPSVTTGMTLCAWIYPTAALNVTRSILSAWRYALEYVLGTVSDGSSYGGLNSASAVSAGTLSVNTWQHVAIRWTGTQLIASIDGVSGTAVAKTTAITAAQPLFIGAYQSAGTTLPFVGYIDDAMIVLADVGTTGLADIRANSPGSHA